MANFGRVEADSGTHARPASGTPWRLAWRGTPWQGARAIVKHPQLCAHPLLKHPQLFAHPLVTHPQLFAHPLVTHPQLCAHSCQTPSVVCTPTCHTPSVVCTHYCHTPSVVCTPHPLVTQPVVAIGVLPPLMAHSIRVAHPLCQHNTVCRRGTATASPVAPPP